MRVITTTKTYYKASSGVIVGELYVSTGSKTFPGKGWTDFPAPVLHSWLTDLGRAIRLHHNTVALEFMDGSPVIRLEVCSGPRTGEVVNEKGRQVLVLQVGSLQAVLRTVCSAAATCLTALPIGRDRRNLIRARSSALKVLGKGANPYK